MEKPSKTTPNFVSRNLVAIVMVPVIVALHFGWNAMQNNRSLVRHDEQIDLPLVTFYKYCVKKLSGEAAPARAPAIEAENR